jgi:hypothetical protein
MSKAMFDLPHTIECLDCCGAGEVTPDHAHDPNARIYECARCLGTGEVPCFGCDECEEP